MRAIDTNVLLRLIARDDRKQVERAEAFVASGAWVSHLVLAETVSVLESVYGLRHNEIAATLQKIGAAFNATTWYDRTNYFETVPSDQLELTIQLEADRMRNSLIADSDRQSEMTVVRNELERGQNEPSEVLDEAVYAAAFREHVIPEN